MCDCIVVGDITLDRFVILEKINIQPSETNLGNFDLTFELGQKLPVKDVFESIGGNAHNVAFGLKNLGINVNLYSHIGTDKDAKVIIKNLAKSHIPYDLINQSSKQRTNSATILSIKGERVILSYHSAKSYTYQALPNTKWVYLTSMGEGSEIITNGVLEQVERDNINLAFNPGSFMLKNQLHLIRKILPKLDIIFINKEEAQLILGEENEESVPNLILSLLEKGIKTVSLTDGINGAYVGTQNKILHINILPNIKKIVETTGAGDAFASGFLASHIKEHSLEESLQYGIINSGSVIQKIGATVGLASQDKINKIINSRTLSVHKI